MRNIFIPLIITIILQFNSLTHQQHVPFTATDMHLMYRISDSVLSLDHKYIVYSVRKWNNETGVSSTNLMYTEIETQISHNLTNVIEGGSDSGAQFSTSFPNVVFFMRDNAVYYKQFPPLETSQEIKLTNYPIAINDFKVKANSLVFSANVYFSCTTLQCSAEQIQKQQSETYQVYDRLYMFDWDTWLPQGKGSHVFLQKVMYDNNNNDILYLNDEPIDLCLGMEINAPPSNTGSTHYDVSKDGKMITFSGHIRDYNESFKTDWKTYYINIDEMDKPVLISDSIKSRTENPRFSKDQTQIAFLSMVSPNKNSYLVIYNILTNTLTHINIDNYIDKSITEFEWYKHDEIIFTATSYQVDVLHKVNFANPATPIYSYIPIIPTTTNNISYTTLISAIYTSKSNFIISTKVAFDLPEQIVKLDLTTNKETIIVDMNKHIKQRFTLMPAEVITYTGSNNDTIYGWKMNPINYNPSSSTLYPAVFLIHGGPESSWTSGWSYRWNPQIWVNQGYMVFMINPHGSIGFTSSYRDAVRTEWGGAPYDDIMKLFDHIENNYKYVDMNRICACGASYGGYMINWLQGHTDRFKCFVNHDGAFSIISKFYSTDEIWFQKVEYCPSEKSDCNPFDGGDIRKEMEKYSPERFVKEWKTPMLVFHGGKDYRVPLTEGLSTFTALQLKNVESKMVYFPKENHWVLKPENSVKWNKEIIAWLDKYIGV